MLFYHFPKLYLQQDLGYPGSLERQQVQLCRDVQSDHLYQQGQWDQQGPREEGRQAHVNQQNPVREAPPVAWAPCMGSHPFRRAPTLGFTYPGTSGTHSTRSTLVTVLTL